MKAPAFATRAFGAALWAAAGDRRLLTILGAALAVRLVLLPWFSDPYNFRVFSLTASFVESGQNPWTVIASDPALASVNPWGYPPLYLVPVLGASALSFGSDFLFGIWIRLPLIAASLLAGLLIYRTAKSLGVDEARARLAAAAYLFNPFVVLIDTVWGINDPLPVLFTVAALYYLTRASPRLDLSALLLGVGIAFKLYPAVLLPVMLARAPSWGARLRMMAFASLPSALTAGPLLLASPAQFLNILGIFVAGGGGAPSHFTVPFVADLGGARGAVVMALVAGYGVGLFALAVQVRKGRMPPVPAWALSLLALFLVAPRLNENYFLWPIAAVTLTAAVGRWPSPSRLLGLFLWLPITVSAFIYNGASGITGPFYWGLVAGAPHGRPYAAVPPETEWALSAVTLAMVAASVLGLASAGRSGVKTAARPLMRPIFEAMSGQRREGAMLAAAVVALVIGAAFVAALDKPVGPRDFPAYSIAGGRVTFSEQFQSALFDQTWAFGGSGAFERHPEGNGSVVLDTQGTRGNAFLSRLVPNTTVEVSVTARVHRVEGTPGLLLLARVPAGWVGAQNVTAPPGGMGLALIFFDEAAQSARELGRVPLGGWFSFEVTVEPNRTEVRFGPNSATAGGGALSAVLFGQRDAGANLGGRVEIDRLSLAWAAPPNAPAPALGPALWGLSSVTLVFPIWWWRRRAT